jgi:hypothetical protein
VTLRGIRAGGAFGAFNAREPETGERLRKAFNKAKELALQQSTPTTRKFPLSALRRQFSRILGLDVIFSPKLIPVVKDNPDPRGWVPVVKTWEVSPVWRCAPPGAVEKSEKISSLLHIIATDGYKANIVHDLVRLSNHIWTMSIRSFRGLIRRIRSRIQMGHLNDPKSSKRPDPLLLFSKLSKNPVANYYRVSRYENRKRTYVRKYGTRHSPKDLWLRANLLGTKWYKTHVRQIGLRQPG